MFFKYAVCVVLLLLGRSYVSNSDCEIPISPEFERKFPVILNNVSSNLELYVPQTDRIKIKDGEQVTLSCPDPRNVLTTSNSNLTTFTCSETKFEAGRTKVSLSELQCKNLIKGSVQQTGKKCAKNKGNVINIGYNVGRNVWLTLIKVCYNNLTGGTFYSEHTLHGDVIKYASKSNHRPSFSTLGLGNKIAASVAYKRAFQKATFNKLLHSSALAELYISNSSYLSRGHLAPDADFLFASWQFTTYFYINTNPQWQHINGGNWRRLEIAVKKQAKNLNQRITVFTGSHGVLQLPDANKNLVDIYMLADKMLPVPKYFWKILYSPDVRDAIVFVNLNNPFVEKLESGDVFCDNVCDRFGWSFKRWNELKNGIIFCCDFKAFSNVVSGVPELHVKDVMVRKI